MIVGVGYIVVEFVGVVNELGVEIYFVFRKDYILCGFDDMVISEVMVEMEKLGIFLYVKYVFKFFKCDEGGKLIFEVENGKMFVVDCVIWVIGCGLNVDMGFENIDIVLNDKGYIKIDEFENIFVDGVYVIGDVNGKIVLILVVIVVGCCLLERFFNYKDNEKLDYYNVFLVIFIYFVIGMVGFLEVVVIE